MASLFNCYLSEVAFPLEKERKGGKEGGSLAAAKLSPTYTEFKHNCQLNFLLPPLATGPHPLLQKDVLTYISSISLLPIPFS